MICTSVCLFPRVVYLVGPVEPVELRGVWCAQVEPLRGTGGTGVGLGFWWREGPVPTVTPVGSTENRQKRVKYHRFHRLHLPNDGPPFFRRFLESIS